MWWRFGAPAAGVIERILLRVRIEGTDRIPDGPAILAFNHLSMLDGPMLAIEVAIRRRRPCRFLVAAEMFGRFFFGWVLRKFQQIPIRRGGSDSHALDEAISTVSKGALVAIAPEGRVNDDDARELQRIRAGVARIAMPTGAPVIPVGLWGTQRRWPRSGVKVSLPLRPVVGVSVGDPFDLPAGDDPENLEEALELVRAALERQVARAKAIAGPD